MIKWILFDQNGVQTKDTFADKESYSINGKTFSASLLESIYDLPEYYLFDIGKFSEEDLISVYLEKNSLDLSCSEFIDLYKQSVESIEGISDIIVSLKNNNYHIASVINEGFTWANYKLDCSGFRKFFDYNIISGDIGLLKPDVAFYKKTLEVINAEADQCVFIDDKKENCDVASKLGMHSIYFKNSIQLKEELIALNVKLH